jgi:hypothetical protein
MDRLRRKTFAPVLGGEAILFGVAALVHAGVIALGDAHARAATAESVIALVLVLGVVACLMLPQRRRGIALTAQSFALLGTLVGAFTIAIGIGPQARGDLIYHAILLIVLVSGLVAFLRSRR